MKNNWGKIICIWVSCLFLFTGCSSIDKALYDISDSVSSVDRVTGQRSLNLYDRAAQIEKSNQQVDRIIAEKYVEQGKPVNGKIDLSDYRRLQTIFKKVHQVSHMSDEEWEVVMIPEKSFNAFVTGGTYVIVHHGVLSEVESDDELAYILGHEIAHVSANHVYESQSYNMGAMLSGSKSARRGSFQAAFTHENEEEADKIGLLYATLAGYNPEKASESWKRMGEKYGYHASTYSTHPIAKERANNNEQWASLYNEYYIPGKINPDHEEILLNNPVFGKKLTAEQSAAGEGGGLKAFLDTAFGALSTRAQAKNEEARQAQRIAFIKQVESTLGLVGHEVLSDKKVKSTLTYKGNIALQEIILKAKLGQQGTEIAIGRVDNIVYPNNQFSVVFEFKETDVAPSNVRQILIGLDYAERAGM